MIRTEVRTKTIRGYPGYRISDDGTVWTKWGKGSSIRLGRMSKTWKKLKAYPGDSLGHPAVQLFNKYGGKYLYVHTLVLRAFVGSRPEGLQCRHLDNDPTNNHLSNLCWGTQSENEQDKIKNGTANRGQRHGMAKLTDDEVIEIRRLSDRGYDNEDIASRYPNVKLWTVWAIVTKRIWKHLL